MLRLKSQNDSKYVDKDEIIAKQKALINEAIMYCEEQSLKYDFTACNVLSILTGDLPPKYEMYSVLGVKKINGKEYPEFTELKQFKLMRLLSSVNLIENRGLLTTIGNKGVELIWHPRAVPGNELSGSVTVTGNSLPEALDKLVVILCEDVGITDFDKVRIGEILESED